MAAMLNTKAIGMNESITSLRRGSTTKQSHRSADHSLLEELFVMPLMQNRASFLAESPGAKVVRGRDSAKAKGQRCKIYLQFATESSKRETSAGNVAGGSSIGGPGSARNHAFFLVAICLLFFGFSLSSCHRKSNEEIKQQSRFKTYQGDLFVDADAGLQPILKQQEEVFNYFYDSVQTHFQYKNEKEMFDDFRSKKATLLLLSRELQTSEINDFRNIDTIYIRQLPVAYDAVALIGSPDFDDKDLDLDLLKKYFDPKGTSTSSPKLVFENQNSSTVRFILNVLGYKEKVSPNVFAVQSASGVIDYVAKNKNVIGFIPFNMVSDTDDDRVKETLKQIKILSLRAKSKEGEAIRVSANQSDIAEGVYPLIRTVNTVTRNTSNDNLELLLVSFLSQQRGAKIFLKAGLMPVKVPEREINVNEGPVTGGGQ
jgi:phosphate transport system substrate-binding protein